MGIKLLLAAAFFSLSDVALTCVFLAQGRHWENFLNKIRDKEVATTGYDFLILSLIRGGGLIGALIGMLRNPGGAPKRIQSMLGLVYTVNVGSAIYLCAKLLIYSEKLEFINGSVDTVWFWVNFSWGLFAALLSTLFFTQLSNPPPNASEVRVDVNGIDSADTENSPLLKDAVNHEGSSINQSTKEHSHRHDDSASSTSDSDSSDDEDGGGGGKKKKKGFSELVNKVTIRKMLSYSKQDAWLICLAIIFLFGAAIAEIFIPLFTGRVISGIAIDQDSEKFTKNIMIMALITVAASLCAGCRGGIMSVVISRFNMRIRNTLFSSITRQEIGFFDSHKTGEMLSRLTSDTSTMSDMIGLNCNIFLRSVVKAVGTCIFMFSLSWRLSTITFMGLPLVVIVSKLYGNYYKKLQTKVQDAYASANEVAEEVCSSMRTVRSFANESGERERYKQKMLDVYAIQLKQALAYAGYMWSSEYFELILYVAVLWYGGHLVSIGLVDPEIFISIMFYMEELGESFENFGEVYTGLMQALGAADKVFKFIDREPEIDLSKGKISPPAIKGHIRFDNVCFSYPSRPNQKVLKNISFDAPPGQVTALVGPSGGGKSSCVNLIQHFYETEEGSILIDGIPVQDFSHKYLHQKISLVGQEPVLYARSIKENISYGLEEQEFVMADVVEAAREANAHNFITELSDQYETETGEKGTQLSGGQKQRIAIARALIRNPKILLLDEATSALDTESEYLVQQALQKTLKDRTVIVIAHRLSTVETADKIVVINKGEIMEEGTHAQLMKESGMYYKLVHRQLHGGNNHDRKKRKSESERKSESGTRRRKPRTGNSEGHDATNSISIPNDSMLSRSLSISSSLDSNKSENGGSRPGSYKI